MSNQWPWQDRRGMFQKGRELHDPAPQRRPSGSSGSGSGSVVEAVRRASTSSNSDASLTKVTSNTSTGSTEAPRRRSSASQGMFGNLMNTKRGTEDYGERRASQSDHQAGGVFSGWYNKTFKGMQEPGGAVQGSGGTTQSSQSEERRGVME